MRKGDRILSINFTELSNRNFFGRLLRLPLHLIPSGAVLPILQGRLRGYRWVAGSAIHGCWLGSYENDKQKLFSETVSAGASVYDIGANVGFYTLLASEIVGPEGHVASFEPLPENLKYLKRHIEMNHLANVTLFSKAVGDEEGHAFFSVTSNRSGDRMMGHLADDKGIPVEICALDPMLDRSEIKPPDFLKIDVEGAELHVLQGGRILIDKYKPVIFLATHGPKVHQECLNWLNDMGYRLQGLNGRSPDATDEILAVHPDSKYAKMKIAPEPV
jgi:FkbM family methyltransferase